MHSITQDQLETLIQFNAPIRIIDARKKPAVEKDPAMVHDAEWQDYERVAEWADSLTGGQPVICYCVHGHEVSQSTVAALRARGIDAYYLRGGFHEWQARSGPLKI